MAKNKQKQEKAARNREYARKFKKRVPKGVGKSRFGGPRPGGFSASPTTEAAE